MKLKDNKALQILSKLVGEDKDKLSERICHELLDADLIRQDCDNGSMMLDLFERSEESWPELVKILFDGKWSNEIQANFLECILLGDGECEHCGGDMNVWDEGNHVTVGDGYNTPIERIPRWVEKKCLLCGHKQIEGNVPDPDFKRD